MSDDISPSPHNRACVLVVDDEPKICELLVAFLRTQYAVESCVAARDALALIASKTFDLVITDLKLPDGSGIDILQSVKLRDAHAEVIIVTGFASLDTATSALNLGVSSYLTKPVSLASLKAQVDRALANRDFHLKSRTLMERVGMLDTGDKRHLFNITSVYDMSRKLMASIDVADIMRIILQDLNEKMGSTVAAIGVCLFGDAEVFAMPNAGAPTSEEVSGLLHRHWETLFGSLDRNDFARERVSLVPFEGHGTSTLTGEVIPMSTPMIAAGRTIGSLCLLMPAEHDLPAEGTQFLHVLSSLISPLVENAYVHKRTKSQASTDALTGIANHRAFQELLSREIARTNRDKTDFSLLILDIDDFKKVNDTYGHLIGDAVLKDMTVRVNEAIRLGDIFARYGGEEFALLLPNTGAEGALSLAERIRRGVGSHPYVFYGQEIACTVSIGVSQYSGTAPRGKDELIREADEALYVSKREGKNRITVH